ncbi:hypothetical protein GCM10007860_10010 [Chitiniphilus shinanonensis]|uniref:DUF2252 domain-containing protein n=1 Tax=Chitiniphilus shinanonensis TaxID=553088 RepID=A0ABQ6BRA1_9NEIS|nr:DUF2252 domain-containing protein [Chitiniphilus shinanonensis]GLS03856.1 hypothetical protein GCM10007860_10010 [Chitiniphilus shinanonensis]
MADAAHSLNLRVAAGRALRRDCPRRTHALWRPSPQRDPIAMLQRSSEDRVQHLVPIRYGRMLQSPFAFYRATALLHAFDLADTPHSGIRTQLCGDCHLMNFGGFATPERNLLFGINDFDETLPGFWEWDLKRLTTSFVLAARYRSLSDAKAREIVQRLVASYRHHIDQYAAMKTLDLWHASISFDDVRRALPAGAMRDYVGTLAERARKRTSRHAFDKMTATRDGVRRILDNPPYIFHPDASPDFARYQVNYRDVAFEMFGAYTRTLHQYRRHLIERFELVDVVFKVVGVGSVGTRCFVLLMLADDDDPLFLQAKEAKPSVLAPYMGRSQFRHQGERVVAGQRLMQAASDQFLGWTTGPEGRHYYIRQLRDMKVAVEVELMDAEMLAHYAELCAWNLARAHAKGGGTGPEIAGYVGDRPNLDLALADYAVLYADQTERDYDTFVKAVRAGTLPADTGDDRALAQTP